jgi:hypothetical protein
MAEQKQGLGGQNAANQTQPPTEATTQQTPPQGTGLPPGQRLQGEDDEEADPVGRPEPGRQDAPGAPRTQPGPRGPTAPDVSDPSGEKARAEALEADRSAAAGSESGPVIEGSPRRP